MTRYRILTVWMFLLGLVILPGKLLAHQLEDAVLALTVDETEGKLRGHLDLFYDDFHLILYGYHVLEYAAMDWTRLTETNRPFLQAWLNDALGCELNQTSNSLSPTTLSLTSNVEGFQFVRVSLSTTLPPDPLKAIAIRYFPLEDADLTYNLNVSLRRGEQQWQKLLYESVQSARFDLTSASPSPAGSARTAVPRDPFSWQVALSFTVLAALLWIGFSWIPDPVRGWVMAETFGQCFLRLLLPGLALGCGLFLGALLTREQILYFDPAPLRVGLLVIVGLLPATKASIRLAGWAPLLGFLGGGILGMQQVQLELMHGVGGLGLALAGCLVAEWGNTRITGIRRIFGLMLSMLLAVTWLVLFSEVV